MSYREHMQAARSEYVRAVLEQAGGCVIKAAQIAGVDRSYLHKMINSTGIRERRAYGNAAWRELRS